MPINPNKVAKGHCYRTPSNEHRRVRDILGDKVTYESWSHNIETFAGSLVENTTTKATFANDVEEEIQYPADMAPLPGFFVRRSARGGREIVDWDNNVTSLSARVTDDDIEEIENTLLEMYYRGRNEGETRVATGVLRNFAQVIQRNPKASVVEILEAISGSVFCAPAPVALLTELTKRLKRTKAA